MLPELKQKHKMELLKNPKYKSDAELMDRVDRYEAIMTNLMKVPGVSKKPVDPKQSRKMIEQTYRFAQVNIPWLKNMSLEFKRLSEKNERYLTS